MSFGASPFGPSPFGSGSPSNLNEFSIVPVGTMQRTFAPPNQIGLPSPLLADNIDPATKDFRDLFVGMDPVDAAVQVAVTTTRGSGASVRSVGMSLTSRKLGSDFKRITEADMRLALQDLVLRRDIAIAQLTFGVDGYGNATGSVNESDASAQINVSFINLRAFDNKVRSVQLSSGATAALPIASPPPPPPPNN